MLNCYALNVNLILNLNPGHQKKTLPKPNVSSSGCVTSLVSSRKTTLLPSHFMSVPPGPIPVSSQPCTLCITDHYQGASLNSLPARLFWRASELGRGKSNTAWYLFNESDLLSCLYLRADCPAALLSSFVTLFEKSVAMSPLSLSPSASQPDVMGPPHRCAEVIPANLSSTRYKGSPIFCTFL